MYSNRLLCVDGVLWAFAVVVLAAGIYGNSAFANEYSVFERTLALVPMALVAIFAATKTSKGAAFMRLVKSLVRKSSRGLAAT